MNTFGKWLDAIIKFKSLVLVKSIIAFIIIAIYAFIRMAISGEDLRMSMVESMLMLVGAIILANIIVNAISRKF